MSNCKRCAATNPCNVPKPPLPAPILFHRVDYPAALGDDTTVDVNELKYRNVLLVFSNDHAYLFSSDGIPTRIDGEAGDLESIRQLIAELGGELADETTAREQADAQLSGEIEANKSQLAEETTAREEADANLQSQLNNLADSTEEQLDSLDAAIDSLQNVVVQKDTKVSGDASTVTLTKTTGALEDETDLETALPLPVASETAAGVMNPATFKAVQENSENIDSILNGAVLVDDLPASPTQDELTAQWKAETGKTTLINRASIYDKTNGKIWYYYENVNEWEPADIQNPEVNVSVATNESLGIVKGSDDIFIEPDGSMSVVGLDQINSDIENLTNEVAGIEVPKVPAKVVGGPTNQSLFVYRSEASAALKATSVLYNGYVTDSSTGAGGYISNILNIESATSTRAGAMSATDKSKLDNLPAITEIGENLELTEEGVLNATGGGSEYELPEEVFGYNSSDIYGGVYFNFSSSGTTSLRIRRYNTTAGTTAFDTIQVPLVSSSQNGNGHAGFMSATDKTNLDNLVTQMGDVATVLETLTTGAGV